MGNDYGISSYPESDKPVALLVTYFRKSVKPFGDDPEGGQPIPSVPSQFMGYSLVEIPGDHPEDGTPQGMKDVPIVRMPPAGIAAGEVSDTAPTLRIVTRI